MIIEVLHPESVTTAYQIISALYIFGLAFSLRQKKALDARDSGKCQAPFGIDPDFAMNGILMCENAHIQIIHPDANEAKKNYRQGDTQAFEKVPYWDTEHDRALHAIAVRNTQRAVKKGWRWPLNSHQKSDIDDSYKP